MSDRLYNEEFSYWVKTTLALQIAKDGSIGYIQAVMTPFVERLQAVCNNEHFSRFLNKVTVEYGRVKKEHLTKRGGVFKWKIATDCAECTTMFELLQAEIDISYKHVHWKCHASLSTISPSVYWWIICKIYISYNIEDSLGPQEVDPLAVFSLMTLCRLFESVKDQVIELIDLRNRLMHNKDNTLSKEEMLKAFTLIKEFLLEDKVNLTSQDARTDIEQLETKQLLIVGVNEECHELVRRALLLKKQCLENDLETERSLGNPLDNYELLLKHTTAEIDRETQNVYGVERRKTEEIYKLKEEISHLKANLEIEQNEKRRYKTLLDTSECKQAEQQRIHSMLMQKIQELETQRQCELETKERYKQDIFTLQEQVEQLKTKSTDWNIYEDCAKGASAGGLVGAMGAGVPGAVVGSVIGGSVQATITTVRRVLHK